MQGGGLTTMPSAYRNLTSSFRQDEAEFLQSLAKKEPGAMSRFLRGLVDASPEYKAWLKSRQH